MNYKRIKSSLSNTVVNIPGYKTKRKLIVFESDDWGAIRMPDKTVYKKLLNKGIIKDDDPFTKFDTIASSKDLYCLFDTLTTVKDYKGNNPVITANCVVANPDFIKIKEHDFSSYFYEPITETFEKYKDCENNFDIWSEGLKNKLFFMQFHGREHLNVHYWLQKLQNNSVAFSEAFKHKTYAIDQMVTTALAFHNAEQQSMVNQAVENGYRLFEEIFNYSSKTFIAPNYTWDKSIEKTLHKLGVKFIQGSKKQNVPQMNRNRFGRKYHFNGQKNSYGQYYLVRNCLFEPAISPGSDYVNVCMKHISNAFYWNKPAIISSHRLNYVGGLERNNIDKNLKSFKYLLQSIIKKWPKAEFMTSAELSDEILKKN